MSEPNIKRYHLFGHDSLSCSYIDSAHDLDAVEELLGVEKDFDYAMLYQTQPDGALLLVREYSLVDSEGSSPTPYGIPMDAYGRPDYEGHRRATKRQREQCHWRTYDVVADKYIRE
jgi:hypothetical protein